MPARRMVFGACFLRLGGTIKKNVADSALCGTPSSHFPFSNTPQVYTLFWRDGAGFGVGAFLSDMGGHWGTSGDIYWQKFLWPEPLTGLKFSTQRRKQTGERRMTNDDQLNPNDQ